MPSPEWIWAIGIIALAIAMGYGVMRARRRTPTERATTEHVTREGYRAEDLQEKKRSLPD